MAFYNGTAVIVDAQSNPLAQMTESTFSLDQDLPDASNKDSSGWAEHINGQKSASISVSGRADMDDDQNVDKLTRWLINQTQVTVVFEVQSPGGTQTMSFSGTYSMADVEVNAPNEDTMTIDGTFESTGTISASRVS